MSKEILLLGEFSSGKSAFVNMFLGLDFIPEKLTSTNLPIMRISGEKPAGLWLREKYEKNPLPLDNLTDIPNDWENIDYAAITLPAHNKLNNGLIIWDTPGINSTNEQHIRHLESFLSIRENKFAKIYYFVKGNIEKTQIDFLNKWKIFHPFMEILLNIKDNSSEATIEKLFDLLSKIIHKEIGNIPVRLLDFRDLYDEFYEEAKKRRADINDWALIRNQEKIKVDVDLLLKQNQLHVNGFDVFGEINKINNQLEIDFSKLDISELKIYVNKVIPSALYEYGFKLFVKCKYSIAIKYIQQAADLGVADAQYFMFRLYHLKSEMLKSIMYDKKILFMRDRYLKLAFNNNNVLAKIYCLEKGLLIKKDPIASSSLLYTLAKPLNPNAQFYLFKCYLLGIHENIEIDHKKAWEISMLMDKTTHEFRAAEIVKKIIDNNLLPPENVNFENYDLFTLLNVFEVIEQFNHNQIIYELGKVLVKYGMSIVRCRILDIFDLYYYESIDDFNGLKAELINYKDFFGNEDLYILFLKVKLKYLANGFCLYGLAESIVESALEKNIYSAIISVFYYLLKQNKTNDEKYIYEAFDLLRNKLSYDSNNIIKRVLAKELIIQNKIDLIKEGIVYLSEMSKSGDLDSQELFGYLYYHGEKIDHNIFLAKYWFEEAAKNGSNFALKELDNFKYLKSILESNIEITHKEYAMFCLFDNDTYEISVQGKIYSDNKIIVNDDNPMVYITKIKKYYLMKNINNVEHNVWHPAIFFSEDDYIWYKYDSENFNCYKGGELIKAEWVVSDGIESIIYDKTNKINIIIKDFDGSANNQFRQCKTERFLWSKENKSYWLTLNGRHIANETENSFKGADLIVNYIKGNRVLVFENYANISKINDEAAKVIDFSCNFDKCINENEFYCGLKFSIGGVLMSINGVILSSDLWSFSRNGSDCIAYEKNTKRYFILQDENIQNGVWYEAKYFADGEYLYYESDENRYSVLYQGVWITSDTNSNYYCKEFIILFDKVRGLNLYIFNPTAYSYSECVTHKVSWSKDQNSYWITLDNQSIANECESYFSENDLIVCHRKANMTIKLEGYSGYNKVSDKPGKVIGTASKFNEFKPFSKKIDEFLDSLFN